MKPREYRFMIALCDHRQHLLLLTLLSACPAPGDNGETSSATTSVGSDSSGEPTGGGPVCADEAFSWDLANATATVLAPDWTGDPGGYTRKISAACTVEVDPGAGPQLELMCADGATMRAVAIVPNPHLQISAGQSLQLDFLEDDTGLYPESWLAVHGPDGIDLHFLAIHAGSLQPPAPGFFGPLVFSEASDCPQFVVGEDCYGTTPKLINAQAEQGPAITLAQSEFGTVTASFGGFLVKVIHAFRFDALTPCDIQDPTGTYFDLTAVFQFPPD